MQIFGGKDENGKRYGIYVEPLWGSPRKYKFVAYGRLGNIDGWVESRTEVYSSYAEDIWNRDNISKDKVLREDISKTIQRSTPEFFKAHMLSEGSPDQSLL